MLFYEFVALFFFIIFVSDGRKTNENVHRINETRLMYNLCDFWMKCIKSFNFMLASDKKIQYEEEELIKATKNIHHIKLFSLFYGLKWRNQGIDFFGTFKLFRLNEIEYIYWIIYAFIHFMTNGWKSKIDDLWFWNIGKLKLKNVLKLCTTKMFKNSVFMIFQHTFYECGL